MAKPNKSSAAEPVDPAPLNGSYVCVEPVKHNGKPHQPGDPIELTEDEAATLLAMGAINQPEKDLT